MTWDWRCPIIDRFQNLEGLTDHQPIGASGTYELEATLANYIPNKVIVTVVEGEVQEVNLALEPIVLP